MKLQHSVVSDSKMFEKVSRSILFGHGLSAPPGIKASPIVDTSISVIVIGATEDSAEQRVKNCFKGTVPDNVACFGADSEINVVYNLFQKFDFNGHVIFCPEISYLREETFTLFADVIHIVGKRVSRHASGCEMHVLMPTTEILENLLGALFEIWKGDRPNHWFIYDERNKFSRAYRDSQLKLEKRKRNLGFDGEFDEVLAEGEERLAAPFILDPAKTFLSYANPREEFDRSQLHPIRLGEDFCQFSPHVIRDMLSDLCSFHGVDQVGSDRDICIHDLVAWKLFLDSVRPHLPYYNDGPDDAACAGSGKKQPKKRIVHMEEISK